MLPFQQLSYGKKCSEQTQTILANWGAYHGLMNATLLYIKNELFICSNNLKKKERPSETVFYEYISPSS